VQADEPDAAQLVTIHPTLTPTGELPSRFRLHAPASHEGLLAKKARELDMLLRDTAQDLGLAVDLSTSGAAIPQGMTERAQIERAASTGRWQVSPRLELLDSDILVRLVVVPPNFTHALVRAERMPHGEFQVRVVVMLRDLVRAGQGQPVLGDVRAVPGAPELDGPLPRRRRSEGRAILAFNAALFGGYVGYSLQKASGSDDDRLTYPLLALGTGVGVGGSLIMAEEWDVGVGDAWYVSAGVVWPTLGGRLVARGREVDPKEDRFAWGLAAGFVGLTLASVSLTFGGMADSGAAVAHSGGLLGIGFGAGAEAAIRGTTSETPFEGMGYGAIAGVLLGGIVGRYAEIPVARVMMVDVGSALGALSFAAVASPLLIADPNEARERAWAIATMSGAVTGGLLAYWVTDEPASNSTVAVLARHGQPIAGVIGHSMADDGSVEPAYGVGWRGSF
jgi:hypothetical protein